jgi:hypothetical protein
MNTKPIEIEPIDEESQFVIDQLYHSTPTTMVMPDGQTTEVPDTGNIALLAYGYRGIVAWRKKREEVFGERIYSPYLEILKTNHKQKEEAEKEKKNGK